MSDAGKKIVPESLDQALSNMTDAPTKEIGSTFADIWYLVFGKLHYIADKKRLNYKFSLEEFEKELQDKMERIPQEERVSPDLQIVGPALEASKYCVEKKEIRALFPNLIAASCTREKEDSVLPCFADIIRQLTPRDTSNLALFVNSPRFPIVHYQYTYKKGSETALKNVFLANRKYGNLYKQSRSISSLERLGLLKIYEDTFFLDKTKYNFDDFYHTYVYRQLLEEKNDTVKEITCYQTIVEITPLGIHFLNICMQEEAAAP